jgi:hypothetical protein
MLLALLFLHDWHDLSSATYFAKKITLIIVYKRQGPTFIIIHPLPHSNKKQQAASSQQQPP